MSADEPEDGLSPEERDAALAAEHALGLLEGEDREAAERRTREDARFAAEVEAWHRRLAGWLQDVPEATPSERVWTRLESAIGPPKREHGRDGLLSQLWLWRATTAGAMALAASLAVVALLAPSRTGEADARRAAALAAPDGHVAFVATFDADGAVAITPVDASLPADHSWELWLAPEQGDLRSLGLVRARGTTVLEAPRDLRRRAQALAISLEPAGGSPREQASGPVIAKGALSRS